MDQRYLVIVVIAAMAAVFASVAFLYYRYEKNRREAFQKFAEGMMLGFSPAGDETLKSSCAGFHLFSHGHSKKLFNLIHGRIRDAAVEVFEYRFTVGSGKHHQTHTQTVFSAKVGGRLPAFGAKPEKVWHRLGKMLGMKDINFDGNPEFSKMYLLGGDDEYGIRRLFTDRVMHFLTSHPGVCIEGEGSRIIVYRQSRRVKPEELRSFIEEGLEALAAIREASAHARS